MDVWAFLNWLWGQIDKVIDWFSSAYWKFTGYLHDFFRWLDAYATMVYNEVTTWAVSKFNDLKAWVTNLYNYLANLAAQVYNDATSYARHLYNLAIDFINSLINTVTNYAVSLYHRALDAIVSAINDVIAWVIDRVNAAKEYVINLFDPLRALIPVISVILSLTDRNTAAKLLQFVQSLYGQVLAFFDDPLGFILGLVWAQAVTFFCFVVGYGLGSVNASLPAIPVWGKNFHGGGGIPPYIPPNGGGALGHPVDPLYVSGYIFGANHPGDDFGIVDGQDIHAAHDGVITFAGWDISGYGNRVDVSGNPYWSRYGHNKQINVSVGDHVTKGQVISQGNSTGNSTGSHLHFELKVNGSYVDPLLYL